MLVVMVLLNALPVEIVLAVVSGQCIVGDDGSGQYIVDGLGFG